MNKLQRLELEFDPSELLGFVADFDPDFLVRKLHESYCCLSQAALKAMKLQGVDESVYADEVADSLWYLQRFAYCISEGMKSPKSTLRAEDGNPKC